MHKGCIGIRGKLKKDSKFKCQACANQQTDIAEDCPGIELKVLTVLSVKYPEIFRTDWYTHQTWKVSP